MRIEDVDPGEPRPLLLVDPRPRARDDVGRRPLRQQKVRIRSTPAHVVVSVEPLREAELAIQRERTDEGACRIAFLFGELRDRGRGIGQLESSVVAHSVIEWITAGHDAGVRRQRHDRMCVGEREPNAIAGEGVEIVSRRASAVAAERVCAQRVDRDEQYVSDLRRV